MFLFFSPVFDGIYDFCSMYTGATMEGCVKLNNRVSFPIVYNVHLNAYINFYHANFLSTPYKHTWVKVFYAPKVGFWGI